MKIAYILYDGITCLDFIGFYDPISRLKSMNYIPQLSWDLCAKSNSIKDSFGLEIVATSMGQPLNSYDLIFVPGGYGTRELVDDESFIEWLQTASEVPLKTSVCTGSLLLGAAGFLKDSKATTHFDEYDALSPYCSQVLKKKIVDDGNVITAGAVSSSIELGLYLCEKFVGHEARLAIQKRMDYHS